jgi:hypothetical protein
MKKLFLFFVLLIIFLFGSFSVFAQNTAQCNDHIDNDGDGYCDYNKKQA